MVCGFIGKKLKKRYLSAIQYEGSTDFSQKELHTVSFRFKRSNLIDALEINSEKITAFRRNQNQGLSINPLSESIAFKSQKLWESEKTAMKEITTVLKNMVVKNLKSAVYRTIALQPA